MRARLHPVTDLDGVRRVSWYSISRLPEHHHTTGIHGIGQEVSYRDRVDHDLTQGMRLVIQGTLSPEIHAWHPSSKLLETIGWNAPVTVDDPSGYDGVVDAREQAYQLVKIFGIETRLFWRSQRGSVLDRLDPVGAILIYQAPQGDRLLQKMPPLPQLVDDL